MNTIVTTRLSLGRKLTFGRMLLLGIVAGLPLATQAGEPARLQVDGEKVSIVVSYADLNLNDQAGAGTLYARLKRASSKVCGDRPSPLEVRAYRAHQVCFENTLNKAVDRVNSQQLYALHAQRGQKAIS
jgi:UrcA family protein